LADEAAAMAGRFSSEEEGVRDGRGELLTGAGWLDVGGATLSGPGFAAFAGGPAWPLAKRAGDEAAVRASTPTGRVSGAGCIIVSASLLCA
jgi:hypothetical protein